MGYMRSTAKTLREYKHKRGHAESFRNLLPPKPDRNIGREADLIKLKQLLSTTGGHRCLLHGPHGVGKSTLALVVAHELAHQNRYGLVVWLDCQQMIVQHGNLITSPTALRSFSDVLRELAVVLGAGAAVRETELERIQLLRNALSQKETLIVCDEIGNLAEEGLEQFLLNLPDSVDVIATSRTNRRWPQSFWLPPISDSFLEELVASELDRRSLVVNSETISEIVELSSGIPLTALWLCRLLDDGVEISEIESKLKTPDADIYDYCFSLQWDQLESDIALLRTGLLLAMASPLPDEDAVGALGSLQSRSITSSNIRRLKDMNLLIIDDEMITMLPLMREYILAQMFSRDEIETEVLFAWIASLNQRIQGALGLATWKDVFVVIDEFRLELFAALRWMGAIKRGLQRAEFIDIVLDSCYYLYSRGYWTELLNAADWVVPVAATKRPDAAIEIGLTWAVRAEYQQQGLSKATDLFENWQRQLDMSSMEGESSIPFRVKVARGSLRDRSGDETNLATDLEIDAEQLYDLGDIEWACRAMLRVGNIRAENGYTAEATSAFVWVTEHADDAPSSAWSAEMMALARGNLGILANRLERFNEAIELLTQTSELAQTYEEATVHGELAFAYWSLDKFREARNHIQSCFKLIELLGLSASVVESKKGWDLEIGQTLANTSAMHATLQQFKKRFFRSISVKQGQGDR
ncbi:MAG: AAA family ATPase [Thermoleophilia bacterium]